MFKVIYYISHDELVEPYNHLHHADALRYLERARIDMLSEMGYEYSTLLEKGDLPVICDIAVRYKREISAEPITIVLHSPCVARKLVKIHQDIYKKDEVMAIQATITFAFMDRTTRRAKQPPKGFESSLIKLLG